MATEMVRQKLVQHSPVLQCAFAKDSFPGIAYPRNSAKRHSTQGELRETDRAPIWISEGNPLQVAPWRQGWIVNAASGNCICSAQSLFKDLLISLVD